MSKRCDDLFQAYKCRCKCFELLLNTNNLEKRNYSNETILNHICWHEYGINLIKLLLKYKADVNTRNNAGNTPLIGSIVMNNNTEYLKLLIEHGADINSKNNYGDTALMYAVSHRKYKHVKLLLEHNADFSVVDNNGKTALTFAKIYNNQEIVKLLEWYIYSNTYNTMITIFDESSTGMLDDLTKLAMEYYI